ncbi:MAG: hypothetical protein EPN98_21420 [Phenylobacterium sp.]|uniref:hypothetical protein n=1 Tax=Phenylobacterium sp. TaxID=1871053 RepID=UPI00120AD13D|nr:hypothetical protein [Phenylobacterium sp.]TAL29005.1 MAG: hypothetical protein EPN98_21420 [Phenylobacterium sp.]
MIIGDAYKFVGLGDDPIVKADAPVAETDEAYATAGRAAADRLWMIPGARTHDDPGRLVYFTVAIPVSQELMQQARMAFEERWAMLAQS